MAKYVIAGKSNCPFYARIELLADELQQRLPDFSVHKIVLTPGDWASWVEGTCRDRGWSYNGDSPIVWKELINRGGKGILIGSSNEFLEIAKGYYGITIDKGTDELELISCENEKSKVAFDIYEEKRTTCSKPYRITVTDAHSDFAYSLLPHLCCAPLSKIVKDIYLTLYSSSMDEEMENMSGLYMELFDCANPELRKVIFEKDVSKAFVGADLVIILNSTDVTTESVEMLKQYGSALNSIKYDTKVIVAGKQAIIACNVILKSADKVNRENIFALSRVQENHAKASIAKKLSVNTPNISNLIIWGSSLEYILDHSNAKVSQYDGAVWAPHIETFSHSVDEMVYDKEWLATELPQVLNPNPSKMTDRDNSVDGDGDGDSKNIKIYLSHTAALIAQLKHILGDKSTGLFSLGVVSTGCYDIPEGLVFSLPCFCNYSKIVVKNDIPLDENLKAKISDVAANLQQYCNNLVKV